MDRNFTLKQSLSSQQLAMLQSEMNKKQKSAGVLWILWLFLGYLGVHRFYLGKIGTGILFLLTAGCLGIGWFVDIFLNQKNLNQKNEDIELDLLQRIKLSGSDDGSAVQA